MPGRSVYYCASRLKPDSTRRNLQTVGRIRRLHVDIDPRDVGEPMTEVEKLLELLDLPPSEVRNSGNGRHVFFDLDTEVDADDTDNIIRAQQAVEARHPLPARRSRRGTLRGALAPPRHAQLEGWCAQRVPDGLCDGMRLQLGRDRDVAR